jgi:anti-anti-sigma factor
MVPSLILSSFDQFSLPLPIVTVDDRSTIIWLAGEQDIAVVDALRTALTSALNSQTTHARAPVVVDLRGVTFIDTTTARALIDATLTQPGATVAFTLRAPSQCVRRMFDLCGRTDLLEAV